ncbi:pyridoxal-phosphate dependent enzyme [Ochrobactrum sp. SFR4]|uniref:pyridoxal-phosphate dependent enzyme n=1 Tax=Ochrobactrum sp. SFR4 TaxID=2717368 RepID=UPI001C8B41F1|nr:pyridoxal-phosphate dependent enzyme [Ochrobactrum sp. SFR4]MBX8827371.1 pyridoxal-phosphate dependent enzyme [Ochrobactrum sp. SFR4]
MQNQRRDIYQEITNKIIEPLENGNRPWLSPWENAGSLPCRPNRAKLEAKTRRMPLLHPFKNASMLAGSCSLGVELAHAMKDDASADDAIVVACGGGGLATGTSLGLRISKLENDIYVAELEHYPRLYTAFNVSHPVEIDAQDRTICDELRVTEIGSLAFSILQKIGVPILAASDAGVIEAQAHMARETGIQAERWLCSEQELPRRYRRLWVIVCGGNV